MMNIVLFGASGFIGSRVAKILHTHGHTLRTPSRSEFDYLQPNKAAARSILNGADAVFNCIGVVSRDEQVLEMCDLNVCDVNAIPHTITEIDDVVEVQEV